MRSGRGRAAAAAAALACALPAAAHAALPSVPVLGPQTPRGTASTVALEPRPAAPRTVDGDPSDWSGTATGFAGSVVRSAGELIYTDHVFDAYGADDGRDARRLAVLDPLARAVPETYRLDAAMGADLAGEFGLPAPQELRYSTNYGDLDDQDRADLTELRVGVDAGALWVLARTTTMASAADAAVLLLLDTAPGAAERTVPFASGLQTARAELAVLLAGDRGLVADLSTGQIQELPAGAVAARPDGWDNAIEARIPAAALPGLGQQPSIAAALGRPTASGDALADLGTGPNVANVAFRTAEPVREWFEREQALALHAATIDPFFAQADLAALAAGASERWLPGPGYHERVFRSSEPLSREQGSDGILQPYGVYVPTGYSAGRPAPLQLWLHWRGGNAHSAAHLTPRIFQDLGERRGALVVSPRGRGTSSWYVGRGMVDVEEVWADVHRTFAVDPSRRYVAGHSMGGWGSFLLSVVRPDWFAGALPASPPVTQGAWTGLDFPGCDEFSYEDYSPCYTGANGGDGRTQHTRRLLENVRHLPMAIFHGVADELVPASGVARQSERLFQLGYRHRLYLFPTQEHYGPPVWDQWQEGARYLDTFRTPARPPRVSFIRDMPFERAVETVNAGGLELDFDFDSAYWLRDLEPADEQDGVASFDGRSLALTHRPYLTLAEAGGPLALGQTGPYLMAGLRWADVPFTRAPGPANGFEATLRGARAAALDLAGMALRTTAALRGRVTADRAVALTLLGSFPAGASATVDGLPASLTPVAGGVRVDLPAGSHALAIQP